MVFIFLLFIGNMYIKNEKKKIMIVDDDYDINNLFKIFLEHDGYRVNAFTDPIDGTFFL